MRNLFRKIRKYANSDAPVLLEGESGVGKEVAANAIHRLSSRASKPFVAVNCAALPGTLIQSELFGCEKGAFTGASERRMGRFEAADGGVLFLDEISDMPLDQQVNLLRFLETRSVERLGGNGGITVDVRIIAASNEDLEIAVKEGRFRKDLFYRLGVLQLAIPSLRDRSADVALLANQVLSSYASERRGKHILGFDQQAQQMMRSHTWPGNVRELINRVRSAVVMTEGHYISAADLGLVKGAAYPPQFQNTLEANRTECDRRTIESALACCQHNMSQAARELGVSRTTLYRMVDKLAISVA
jgi:DNA-binding NtrC family response regulator